MHEQWNRHNEDHHGSTPKANHGIIHECLMGQIAELYAQQDPEMLAADRAILAEPIKEKAKHCPAGLALWLERNQAIVKLGK
jgi:hypothetical protein